MAAMAQQQQSAVKVQAFRQFAMQLLSQVTEQLCAEFEREVNVLSEDVVLYRAELARCGDLLASQLGREKQLHGMLANIAGNTGSLVAQASEVGQKHSQIDNVKTQMHDMVEQMFGHSTNLIQTTIGGVSEAHTVAHSHLSDARELQNQSMTAENELNRIMALLSQPPVSGVNPGPTVAALPQIPQQQSPAYPQVQAPNYPQIQYAAPPMQFQGSSSPTSMGGGNKSPRFPNVPSSMAGNPSMQFSPASPCGFNMMSMGSGLGSPMQGMPPNGFSPSNSPANRRGKQPMNFA